MLDLFEMILRGARPCKNAVKGVIPSGGMTLRQFFTQSHAQDDTFVLCCEILQPG